MRVGTEIDGTHRALSLPEEPGHSVAWLSAWISPQARQTTDPSITDSRVLPHVGQ